MYEITLFGETRCAKTRFYQQALEERGLNYELAEVDKDPDAEKRLSDLTGSADKFPTFLIKGRKLRNPSLKELDKGLARAELYDPGLVHDEKSQRFIWHMAPADAFVGYVWRNNQMILTHSEVAPELRGKGIGSKLAKEVFEHLDNSSHETRITCSFLGKISSLNPMWQSKFNTE